MKEQSGPKRSIPRTLKLTVSEHETQLDFSLKQQIDQAAQTV